MYKRLQFLQTSKIHFSSVVPPPFCACAIVSDDTREHTCVTLVRNYENPIIFDGNLLKVLYRTYASQSLTL